ncbi:MAG: diiron oxygenase [Actinomycetota bacterium]|nr:diiron oxygenase [Actinomycetota bacterium]
MRLLASSAKNSYDPLLDIDWEAPVATDLAFMPLERVSLYGTPMWDRMTEQQRVDLSKHELASIAGTGLWFEIILVQMLARYAYHQDPQAAHTQYALTEIGDETRHIIMFAKAIDRMGAPTYRPPRYIHHLARVYKATARGPALFAPVLVAEEVTDRLQRATMNDDTINPLIRMVNRIHVVEEARHVRFAREEVARVTSQSGPVARWINNLVTALVASFVVHALINPEVYEAVGLDRKEAVAAARRNPNNHETRRWLGEKIMAFLDEQAMVTRATRPIYRLVHLV